MLITGISDVNDINDLRVFITLSMPETLHLVVCTHPFPSIPINSHQFQCHGNARAGRSHVGFLATDTGYLAYSWFPSPPVQNAIVRGRIFVFHLAIGNSVCYSVW
jgi:hypothetical protein